CRPIQKSPDHSRCTTSVASTVGRPGGATSPQRPASPGGKPGAPHAPPPPRATSRGPRRAAPHFPDSPGYGPAHLPGPASGSAPLPSWPELAPTPAAPAPPPPPIHALQSPAATGHWREKALSYVAKAPPCAATAPPCAVAP